MKINKERKNEKKIQRMKTGEKKTKEKINK